MLYSTGWVRSSVNPLGALDHSLFLLLQLMILSLNVSKIKGMIVDYRKQRVIHIDGAEVERVKSFKFVGVHIPKDLAWSKHTNTVMQRAQ